MHVSCVGPFFLRILNFVPLLGALLSDPLSVTLVKKR